VGATKQSSAMTLFSPTEASEMMQGPLERDELMVLNPIELTQVGLQLLLGALKGLVLVVAQGKLELMLVTPTWVALMVVTLKG